VYVGFFGGGGVGCLDVEVFEELGVVFFDFVVGELLGDLV